MESDFEKEMEEIITEVTDSTTTKAKAKGNSKKSKEKEEDIVEGSNKLEVAKKAIRKKFGRNLCTLGERDLKIETISSGSIGLDIALGHGGFARGRLYEIYGNPSSGKSTLTLSIIAQAQKKGLRCVYVDAEHTTDPILFKAMGIDIDKLEFIDLYTGEDNLQALEDYLRSGEIAVAVIDSIAALVPKAEIDGNIEDSLMAALARLMGKATRRFAPLAGETNTLILFINQIRHNMERYDNEVTTGGEALPYYATGRIKVVGKANSNGKICAPDGTIIGHKTHFNVLKNKLGVPYRSAEIDLIYGVGYDIAKETLLIAESFGVIERAGGWYKYKDMKVQGADNLKDAVLADPALYDEIRKATLKCVGMEGYDE